MHFSDEAVVLSLGRFREADVWLRLLSPSRGLFTAFAFGGSKSRKRFCGCLDTLNCLSVSVGSSKAGAYLCLQEARLLSGPVKLRSDFKRLGPVMNSLKFLEAFGVAPDGAAGAFALFKELLKESEASTPLPELLPLFFRTRLAFDHGYAIDLESCSCCSAKLFAPAEAVCYEANNLASEQKLANVSNGDYVFSARRLTSNDRAADNACFLLANEGQIFCANCAATLALNSGPLMRLCQGSINVFKHVKDKPICQWQDIEISPLIKRELARAIDSFIEYHVGLRWDRGRFLRC